jgi:hypothetical protein
MMNRKWRSSENCHMFCDNPDELPLLHTMAMDIGLRLKWFQEDADMPHYDLVRDKRNRAVSNGAVETTDREMVRILKEWRTR